MGEGLKQVTMTLEQAAFFYNVLNNTTLCPLKDLESMRKVTRVFDAIEEFSNEYREQTEEVKKLYGKEVYSTNEKGERVKALDKFNEPILDVPQGAMRDFNKAIDPIQNQKVNFSVERNDLEFIKLLVKSIPEKVYKDKDEKNPAQGLGGRRDSKLISEISTALEDASVIGS